MTAAVPSRLSVIDFATDPALLGLSLSVAQRALLRAIYGEPLDLEELDVWRRCTGREAYPARAFGEVTVLAGARSGKDSRIAAPVLLYEALFGGHVAARGERLVFPLVAQDARATRIAFTYVRDYLLSSAVLSAEVAEVRAADIELRNGAQIICFPCTQSSLRGWSIPCGVMDELAHWRLEGAVDSDAEIQTSIRRGGLAFASPRLVKISTPYLRSGVLHDDFARHYGKDSPDVLVWRAPSRLMNPTISGERLERERRLDPERFEREYLAEFARDLSSAFDLEALTSSVVTGRRELPPVEGMRYQAFTDPAGGGRDAFTLAVAHADGERAILDCVRAWRSRNPQGIVEEAAALMKSYRVTSVTGDRYSGEWVREAFRSRGIQYEVSTRDRSAIYLECIPLFNSGRVELLDHVELRRELQNLERRPAASGRDRIDHPANAHDDLANAAAGALVGCLRRNEVHIWSLEESPVLPRTKEDIRRDVHRYLGRDRFESSVWRGYGC